MPSERLAATSLKITKPGVYADGGGLYLQITTSKTGEPRRSWLVRYRAPSGKTREMGLGALDAPNALTLKAARDKAREIRKIAGDGIDPIEQRDADLRARAQPPAPAMTFREAAETYRRTHEGSWRNKKHRQQWMSTLESYAYPSMGQIAVAEVVTGHVLKAVEPIWKTKNETARRVLGRIEMVLDWAAGRDLRPEDNPARRVRRGKILPTLKRSRDHHPALPYAEVAAFISELRAIKGMGAIALEFLILTATRTGETIGARWDEIDLAENIWTIPAERMKAGKPHRVPLCGRAVSILRNLKEFNSDGVFVFSSTVGGEAMSNMALLMTVRRMKRGVTVHGFRSTFRDWAADETDFAREVAEAALAHTVGAVEAAYRRTDFFEKRRSLMSEWANFCAPPPVANGNEGAASECTEVQNTKSTIAA